MQQNRKKHLPLIINLHKSMSGNYQYIGDNMNQINHQQQYRQSNHQQQYKQSNQNQIVNSSINHINQQQINKRRENQKVQNYTQLTKYNDIDKQNYSLGSIGSNNIKPLQGQSFIHQQYQIVNGQQYQESNDIVQQMDSQKVKPEILPYCFYELQKTNDNNQQSDSLVSILPSICYWFDLKKIHYIEKQAFPECFNEKNEQLSLKSQEMYFKYRKFIVQSYRSNPKEYLTATRCRRSLVGDVQLIIKLHSFLEHWGIINFNINTQKVKYQNIWEDQVNRLPAQIIKLDQEQNDDLVQQKLFQLTSNLRPICDFCGQHCNLIWFKYKEEQANELIKDEQIEENDEDSNQQDDKSNYKQNKQLQQLVICIQCYYEDKYPSILSKDDFEKQNLIEEINSEQIDTNQIVKKPINIQDQQKLLEILAKYKDNWPEIEKQLGKSQHQILVDFMQIPFTNQNIQKLLEKYENIDDDQFGYPLQQIYDSQTNVFQDQSNSIFMHASIFQHLLKKYKSDDKQQGACLQNGKSIQKNEIDELDKLDQKDQKVLLDIEQKTIQKAQILRETELDKINKITRSLIKQQMNKLETKVRLFEVYEKIIIFEKKQLKLHQQTIISQRIQEKKNQYS